MTGQTGNSQESAGAPDGSVTRALAGLRALSLQMAEDSGIDNPMEKWMTDVFGRWRGLLMALLSSLACFAGVLVCCGCCCIPCARTLCSRLITTALQKEIPQPPPSSEAVPLMPLMDFPDQPDRADNEGGLEPTAPDYEYDFPHPREGRAVFYDELFSIMIRLGSTQTGPRM